MAKKILIIGSGFNALATAYFLKSKNFDLKILFERNIKGVLSSVKIEDESFDLGYQFFDGLDKETEKFIRNMFSNNYLYDFKYGASTYSNNLFYEYHAMPYWKSYGILFSIKAFIFYLTKFLKSIFFKREKKNNSLLDLFNQLPPNIRNVLYRGCEKNFQIKPHELDAVANEMSTFTNFRQTLFGDDFTNFLKKNHNFFDKHLASRRKSNDSLENISLYPKGKSMEFIADKLIEKLKNQDVIFEQCSFDEVNLSSNLKNVQFRTEKFDQVLITTSLSNIQRLFKINLEQNYEHYVSQVFIYFTIREVDFKFQYTQVNDINLYCSRISNCSLYSKNTGKNNHLLIAEIPLTSNSELWGDDNKLIEIAWHEIIKCGIISDITKYEEAKVLKVAKTFPVPKVNFFGFLNELNLKIQSQFYGHVIMIGQGVFTRHKFIKELMNKYK